MKVLKKKHLKIFIKILLYLNVLLYGLFIIFLITPYNISIISYTGSMKPYFNGGEIVLSKEIKDFSSIKTDDILVFKRNDYKDGLIIHRVKQILNTSEGYYFLMKGDNNKYDDGFIFESEIKFKYVNTIIK